MTVAGALHEMRNRARAIELSLHGTGHRASTPPRAPYRMNEWRTAPLTGELPRKLSLSTIAISPGAPSSITFKSEMIAMIGKSTHRNAMPDSQGTRRRSDSTGCHRRRQLRNSPSGSAAMMRCALALDARRVVLGLDDASGRALEIRSMDCGVEHGPSSTRPERAFGRQRNVQESVGIAP